MRFSPFSKKRVSWAVAVLAAVAGVGLLFSVRQPVHAQVSAARVPDLRGPWEAHFPNGCWVPNVWAPDTEPLPACGTPEDTDTNTVITEQSGRVFLGGHESGRDRFTGYIAPDGTVSILLFSPSAHERQHVFFTGALTIEKGNYVMRGYAHGFSPLAMPPPYTPYIQTFEVSLTKR